MWFLIEGQGKDGLGCSELGEDGLGCSEHRENGLGSAEHAPRNG